MKKLLNNYFSLVRNLFPEKKSHKPYLGLDMGTYSCKLIEIIPVKDSFEILNWAVEPLMGRPPAEVMKILLNKLDIQSKNITTGISGQGTLIRYIEMPKMPLADAKLSFTIEADKYFPFMKDQIFTDCCILDANRHGNKMFLVAAAAKRELVEQRIALLSGLGLDSDFIGMNAIAIANVFHVLGNGLAKGGQSSLPDAIAVLDIGQNVSSLILLKNNVPFFTRDIFIGGAELDRRIINVLGVSAQEAEKLKHYPAQRLSDIRAACDNILLNISSELRLSFDYCATEYNTQISKLFLTGGSSLLEGIDDIFSKNLDVPVERWNPFAGLKLLPGVSQDDINKNATCLTVALGLALYQND